jgi:hypothetical protein
MTTLWIFLFIATPQRLIETAITALSGRTPAFDERSMADAIFRM